MARKNRITPPKAIFHLTAHTCGNEMLFKDERHKDRIVDILYGVADFSGIDLLAWSILDNHLHIFVDVPSVPEHLWDDPSVEPDTSTYTIRPAECTEPRWLNPAGDSPSRNSAGDGPVWNSNAGEPYVRDRPPLEFHFSDSEMLERLTGLYGSEGVGKMAGHWEFLRSHGRGSEVEDEKERYCRRMYNVSQFMKTLKETISRYYRKETDFIGALWRGRFYSGLVERDEEVVKVVAAYIDYNAPKAGLVVNAADWRWCSFARAVKGGRYAERCRAAYERMYGCGWDEARSRIESVFAEKLPDGVRIVDGRLVFDRRGEDEPPIRLRASQAIKARIRAFSSGAVIGRTRGFFDDVVCGLPNGFTRPSDWSIRACLRLVWTRGDAA